MERRIVISGCSGGGKSTLLTELSRRGYVTVEEAGRRIIADVAMSDPASLPWNDLAAFATRAIAMSQDDMAQHAGSNAWTFFDRGLVDAVTALRFSGGHAHMDLADQAHRYGRMMFFAPPWEEIYETDGGRQHDFAAGVAETVRLEAAYRELGYDVQILPKVPVQARADWIESKLGIS